MPARYQANPSLAWSLGLFAAPDSGAGVVHPSLEAVDAGIEPTWRFAWLLVGTGVVVHLLAFQGVAALPVVVAQFVVNGAMFLFSISGDPKRLVASGAGDGGRDGS